MVKTTLLGSKNFVLFGRYFTINPPCWKLAEVVVAQIQEEKKLRVGSHSTEIVSFIPWNVV